MHIPPETYFYSAIMWTHRQKDIQTAYESIKEAFRSLLPPPDIKLN